jgi:spore germination cell wall hydrolase CwlJ-like protein
VKKVLALCAILAPTLVEAGKVSERLKYEAELACLKANVFFEARGEPFKGKAAVAQVTMNRVKAKQYPNSVCATVFQPHQFSWSKQLPKARITQVMQGQVRKMKPADLKAYLEAKAVAELALQNKLTVLPAKVMHYHATSVNPKWSHKMEKHGMIGNHVFYGSLKKGTK